MLRLPAFCHRLLPRSAAGRPFAVTACLRMQSTLTHRDNFWETVETASQHVNRLTGYSAIEELKTRVIELEKRLSDRRGLLREARSAYADAVQRRADSQRELNDLLQRRSSWAPRDVERFTALFQDTHAQEQSEALCKAALAESESRVEETQDALVRAILRRYHEEQVWSDKIRRVGTWGTWGLMACNIVLFFVVQVVVEPLKRRRYVETMQDTVRDLLQQQPSTHRVHSDQEEDCGLSEPALADTSGESDRSAGHEVERTDEPGTVGARARALFERFVKRVRLWLSGEPVVMRHVDFVYSMAGSAAIACASMLLVFHAR